VSADRDLAIGLYGRRRTLVQRERGRQLRERRLDLVEHRVGGIRAVTRAEKQKATAAANVDDVGSGVPNRGVLCKAQDVAGRRHRNDFSGSWSRQRIECKPRTLGSLGGQPGERPITIEGQWTALETASAVQAVEIVDIR